MITSRVLFSIFRIAWQGFGALQVLQTFEINPNKHLFQQQQESKKRVSKLFEQFVDLKCCITQLVGGVLSI